MIVEREENLKESIRMDLALVRYTGSEAKRGWPRTGHTWAVGMITEL